jgi:hypothetical protein
MAPNAVHTTRKHLTLPVVIFGAVEVSRLLRELESVDDHLSQEAIRSTDKRVPDLPRMSRMLEQLAAENNLDLHAPDARKRLDNFLQKVLEKAPSVHISFAAVHRQGCRLAAYQHPPICAIAIGLAAEYCRRLHRAYQQQNV